MSDRESKDKLKVVWWANRRVAASASEDRCGVNSELSLLRAEDPRLYILWLPVLETISPQAAEQVQVRLPADYRLRYFWDHDLRLSRVYYRVLQLGQRPRPHRIAWDIFLLYGAGVVWDEDPPAPEFWLHQLFLENVPELDAPVLRRELKRMIHADTDQLELPA